MTGLIGFVTCRLERDIPRLWISCDRAPSFQYHEWSLFLRYTVPTIQLSFSGRRAILLIQFPTKKRRLVLILGLIQMGFLLTAILHMSYRFRMNCSSDAFIIQPCSSNFIILHKSTLKCQMEQKGWPNTVFQIWTLAIVIWMNFSEQSVSYCIWWTARFSYRAGKGSATKALPHRNVAILESKTEWPRTPSHTLPDRKWPVGLSQPSKAQRQAAVGELYLLDVRTMVARFKDVVLVQIFQFLQMTPTKKGKNFRETPQEHACAANFYVLARPAENITQCTLSIFSWHWLSTLPQNVPWQVALTSWNNESIPWANNFSFKSDYNVNLSGCDLLPSPVLAGTDSTISVVKSTSIRAEPQTSYMSFEMRPIPCANGTKELKS